MKQLSNVLQQYGLIMPAASIAESKSISLVSVYLSVCPATAEQQIKLGE